MPRGPAPEWRRRKEPVADDWIYASITQAGGKHDPETGHYAEMVMRGLTTREEAAEWKRALFRSARYLHRTGQADVSVSATIRRAGAGWIIRYHAVNKLHAKKYMIEQYGPDASKWPYNPYRKGGN